MKGCEIEKIGMCFVARDIKPIIGNVNPSSCSECAFKTDIKAINILKNIKHAKGLEELYGFGGDCGILSLAIQKILGGGNLVAIGGRKRVKGHIHHTGILYKGMILDVDGLTNIDSWTSRWKDNPGAIFMDELAENDVLLGTCPRNTQEKYLIGLNRVIREPKASEKYLPKNSLKFLLGMKEVLLISIFGTYLLIFYFEKRINPDFVRDILYLFLLKLGDGITKSWSHKVEEIEMEDSEIDKKTSADISRSLLFLIIPVVSILYLYSAGKNDNFVYSLGLFFVYSVFTSSILFNLLSIFRPMKRSA